MTTSKNCVGVFFDFDRTLIAENSDTFVPKDLCRKKFKDMMALVKNKSIYPVKMKWNDIMKKILYELSEEYSKEDFFNSVIKIKIDSGVKNWLKSNIKKDNIHIKILSDSNSFFISSILSTQLNVDITKINNIIEILTHKVKWENNRFILIPLMKDCVCKFGCNNNICKGVLMDNILKQNKYSRIVYVGDGRNDFCPITRLKKSDACFVRKGFALEKLLLKNDNKSLIKCKIHIWNSYADLSTLLNSKIY